MVRRYQIRCPHAGYELDDGSHETIHCDGGLIHYEDYAALEAECERLTHVIDTLRTFCRPVDITAAYNAIGEKEPT